MLELLGVTEELQIDSISPQDESNLKTLLELYCTIEKSVSET